MPTPQASEVVERATKAYTLYACRRMSLLAAYATVCDCMHDFLYYNLFDCTPRLLEIYDHLKPAVDARIEKEKRT